MNDNLPPGCTDSDIDRHFGESDTQLALDGLEQKAQLDLCLEYIDHIDGYQRFDEWAFERIKKEHPEWIIEYFKKMSSFWDWMQQ